MWQIEPDTSAVEQVRHTGRNVKTDFFVTLSG